MQIEELSSQFWQRALATDYSTSGYPTRIPTLTAPNLTNNPGLIAIGGELPQGGTSPFSGGSMGPRCLLILPYAGGSSADDTTFSMEVLGWRATSISGNPTQVLWIPVVLAAYAFTVSTVVGVAGSDLDNTKSFVDQITMTLGPTGTTTTVPTGGALAQGLAPDWFVLWNGLDTEIAPAMICQRTFGFRFLELIFSTGGSAAQCNALYCKM